MEHLALIVGDVSNIAHGLLSASVRLPEWLGAAVVGALGWFAQERIRSRRKKRKKADDERDQMLKQRRMQCDALQKFFAAWMDAFRSAAEPNADPRTVYNRLRESLGTYNGFEVQLLAQKHQLGDISPEAALILQMDAFSAAIRGNKDSLENSLLSGPSGNDDADKAIERVQLAHDILLYKLAACPRHKELEKFSNDLRVFLNQAMKTIKTLGRERFFGPSVDDICRQLRELMRQLGDKSADAALIIAMDEFCDTVIGGKENLLETLAAWATGEPAVNREMYKEEVRKMLEQADQDFQNILRKLEASRQVSYH
jgi:hypothetical protein